MNRYDRYPGDYLRDTTELSMTEDGAYTRLLDWYYSNERPIPNDRRHQVARATSEEERNVTDWVLSRFFKLQPGGWVHERAEKEIAKARQRIETARLNGKRGGRPRKNVNSPAEPKPKENPNSNPPDNPDRTHGENSPSPSPPIEEVDPKTDQVGAAGRPSGVSPSSNRRDRFAESLNRGEPKDRPEVQRMLEVYRRVFDLPNYQFLGSNLHEAQVLSEAIDAYGEVQVQLVLENAPQDGMVSGKHDERGVKHESIGYIVGNQSAFNRILKAALERQGKAGKRRSAAEVIREQKGL